MILAARIPWHKQARELLDRELSAVDPSFLFTWPLARVLAVFFLDAVKPQEEVVDVSDPAEMRKLLARLKAKKNKG